MTSFQDKHCAYASYYNIYFECRGLHVVITDNEIELISSEVENVYFYAKLDVNVLGPGSNSKNLT